MKNIAVIGSGKIVKKVLNEITKNKEFHVKAIYSRNQKSMNLIASFYGGVVCDSVDKLISLKNEYDFVYIATPHSTHFEYAKKCIENKIPVLIEKPISTSSKDIEELINLQKENGVFVSEAMWNWLNEPMVNLKKKLDSIGINRVKEVSMDFSCLMFYSKESRLFDPKRNGGALFDLGVYLVNNAYKLFGKPTSIKSKKIMRHGVDVVDFITFEYPNFSCKLTTSFRKFKDSIIIKFDNGYLKVPSNAHAPGKIIYKIDNKRFIEKNKTTYINEFRTVQRLINEGKLSSEISLLDSLEVIKLIETINS